MQAKRIEAIRRALGEPSFINARTDLYIKTETHDSALVDKAIERPGPARGGNDFFIPRLADPRQVERIVKEVPLPLNLISFPSAPPKADWANAGVARINHGPHPHRALMAKLEEMARRDRLIRAQAPPAATMTLRLPEHCLVETWRDAAYPASRRSVVNAWVAELAPLDAVPDLASIGAGIHLRKFAGERVAAS